METPCTFKMSVTICLVIMFWHILRIYLLSALTSKPFFALILLYLVQLPFSPIKYHTVI